MHKSQQNGPKDGFGIQDIVYIIFKHKWKICLFSLLGFGASAFVYANREPLFQSQAKLLVRYVLNRNAVDESQSQVSQTGGPGNQVINTEIEILTSEDLALAVAESMGPEAVLPEAAGASVADAAGTIMGHLEVGALPGSNVIHINYSSPEPERSVKILKELVQQYSLRHLEIHRSANAFDVVSKQADEVRSKLKATEEELDKLRTESGIMTLAEATTAIETQRARTKEHLDAAKAEYAEQQERVKALEEAAGLDDSERKDAVADAEQKQARQAPSHVIAQYKGLLDLLGELQKRNLELRLKFKAGNRLVALTQQQIADTESKLRALVAQYPDLASESVAVSGNGAAPRTDLRTEQAKLAAIRARMDTFNKLLEDLKAEFDTQYTLGAKIESIERRRQMEDAEYRSLELNLKNAKIDQTLDPSRMPNITLVQQPSTPIKTYDKMMQKIVLGLAGGGMAIGFGLAFLIELLFNRKIHRSTEIHARLQLPLLLSIPYIRRKDRGGLMLSHEPEAPRLVNGSGGSRELAILNEVETPESAIRKANHFILPYSETIRDRMIFNFEINNVTHKPKMVAVTGLSEGAGSSTIAAGLAKSFSEINGVKVLLVDLSSCHPEDSPVFGEVARHSLNGALQLARQPKFKEASQSLYYASATARRDDSGLTTFSPMHLYELMPHLQASDYDYIVFDMPAIDQTSRTLTMAGLMDKVLLVLDAENTSRDALKWGYSELTKGRADVSCIFNKTRAHAPGWLLGDS